MNTTAARAQSMRRGCLSLALFRCWVLTLLRSGFAFCLGVISMPAFMHVFMQGLGRFERMTVARNGAKQEGCGGESRKNELHQKRVTGWG
jgi:hypothetical protein